jgi:hypothetical protein
MNKASYAYRSNRSFYIWIGNLDQKELNRREVDSLGPSFGFRCAEKELENSMHYYKPIALLVLFDMLATSSSSTRMDSIFFLDADSAFTPFTFERIDNDKLSSGGTTNGNKDKDIIFEPIGPESYLGISPQASLMGTTNLGGKMLMNSGLILLRNTQWSRDFLALWWYGRCGIKDQLSMWLVLFATFSAWTTIPKGKIMETTTSTTQQFAYPGDIFFDYNSGAKKKTFMHFRKNAHLLQAAWETVTEWRRKEHKRADDDDYLYPLPTNTTLYNGGSWNLGPKLRGPLELPHVVILPPGTPVSYTSTTAIEGLTVQVDLPRFKASNVGDDSLVIHSKTLDNCSDQRCWPYVT